MGIFADYAELYWELGYSIIPVNTKNKGTFVSYDKYRDKICSKETLDKWVKDFPNHNIGIVTGAASGIAVIDLDIKNNPDLLNKALSIFPRSPVERFGSKGLGIIIKYNGQSHRKLMYKGKDIGELITNTQIVIPPSIHPETKKPYKWTGFTSLDCDLKENILEELPCPDDAEILACLAKLENESISIDKQALKEQIGRNNKLKEIVGAMISTGYLPEQMAPLLLAEDYSLHPDNPLFEDKNEFKGLAKNPLACAYKFSSNIFKTYLNQAVVRGENIPHFNKKDVKEEQKKKEYAKYEAFFKEKLKSCRKDKIDNILKQKDWRDFWQPVGNKIKEIKSYATDYRLKPDRVDMHFRRYESEQKSRLLFDIPRWDGEDHIAEMFFYVSSQSFTQAEMVDFFKQWVSKAYTRINTGEQNHMIVFQGKQGVGKDLFIESLLGGFNPYFNNFTDTMQEKDIFMQIAKNLVINVSEFDKLNKKHPGLIKDLITRRTAEFRPSHMQHHENFRMNASFIGSTNPLNFLTDSTGNRRFWIFDDVQIDWSYPKDKGPQILAQAKHLAEIDHRVSDENLAKMNQFVLKLSPDSLDEFVVEYWDNAIRQKVIQDNKYRFSDIEDSMTKIARLMGFKSIKPVQSIIKRLGGQKKDKDGRYYVPISYKNDAKLTANETL